MGVGGGFWDLLKPYARPEGPDFLRNKRVAVDLSYWIVQHETAIKNYIRNPHLRLTFFRTINLFSKFGAFPIFVLDGTPSPLKSQARVARFFQFSGIDMSSSVATKEGFSVQRNRAFQKFVHQCVELLELFGMPVLKAKGEAEALCAQLNSEGHVDACITADSDAFLFGATCVIKCIRPYSKEAFECYHISDIKIGLGLKREHLIAISLLVGNDHDLNGVQGIGVETALLFVQTYSADEILNRLHEIGNSEDPQFLSVLKSGDDSKPSSDASSPNTKSLHCSFCGHPGSKKNHLKFSCKYCGTSDGCMQKPVGYKCNCVACDKSREEKEKKRRATWQIKVCNKIAMEPGFPNDEILKIYLCNNNGEYCANDGPSISWGSPNTEMLVDFLVFHQHWEPAYIRQRMLPMLSTIYLREIETMPDRTLLCGQYEFDSILRVKMRYGHQVYVVKWKKATPIMGSALYPIPVEDSYIDEGVSIESDESTDLLEDDAPQIHVDAGHCFLLTDENMELVSAAFPVEVDRFLKDKELRESKRRKSSTSPFEGSSRSPKSKGVQLNITEFYRSTKLQLHANAGEGLSKSCEIGDDRTSKEKIKVSSKNISKSVRRRLLF
ncbi:flap endonuclease GEN-like 1-like isoform X2 [Tripterygium wilfordii]|uniref:Flap endonuclease GEN-like 1 n=1 Tax=Tripterygium wilfordii TaxID=458696 RepID=A0A7J7CFW5_TRIWF|nr:flap endonuclease GEN-like 1 [Tripterygium wilfordii]KAF5733000.1 flap endonuclease GEN-like 1-like isoform X2 [Tripterygium wilfordii]